MIEKAMYPGLLRTADPVEQDDIEIEIAEEGPDGLEVDLTDLMDDTPVEFGANLAEHLEDDILNTISDDLLEFYEDDIASRKDWEQTYQDGLDLLGLKIEERTEPWEGACGVSHPLLAEAVVKFQAETIMETFPASGPVKTKIIGKITREKEESAERVRDDMNWRLTEEMTDYRAEHERMLWNLPIAGSAFKKTYYDASNERPVSLFIPAEDIVAPYGATNLESAPRYAHRMKKTKNEFRKLVVSGFYRDIELGDPMADTDEISKRKDEATGMDSTRDDRYTFIEYHIDLDIKGYEDVDVDGEFTGIEIPYVVHMDKATGKIAAIYRNWKEDDTEKRKRIHFVKYSYIPGFGFYDFGLIHLVGGFAKGATSLLRQLVDAGTLSNLPGGLKTKGLRLKGDETPISPGEFRDVDVPSGAIRDNIMLLPYKEPSVVLVQLLQNIVDEGRRFAAVADINVADMQPNSPVGTTLAILERTLKTMSAIQARVHASMKSEFKIIKEIVKDYAPDDYAYEADAPNGSKAKRADYEVIDIIPVSDPNATTMSQRIAMYQATHQLSLTAPQVYDLPFLHRQMVEGLGVKNADKIVPNKDDIKPMDPVTENMALLKGEPIKAFMYQDHEAHLSVHMAFAQDPKLQQMMQNDPSAQGKLAAAMAHNAEHIAFAYRAQIEKQLGVPLPHPDEKLPEEVEVALSRLVAEAGQKLLQQNTAEIQAQQAKQAQEDPVLQMQQKELAIKEQDLQRKIVEDQKDNEIAQAKLQLERDRMESQEKVEGVRIGSKIEGDKAKLQSVEKLEGFRAGTNLMNRNKPKGE